MHVMGDGNTEWRVGAARQSGPFNSYSELLPRQLEAGALSGDVRALALGMNNTFATDGSGALYAWGKGESSKLGHGGASDEPEPKRVAALEGVEITAAACGEYHSAAVDAEGKLYVPSMLYSLFWSHP